jgi:dehydrogenase/reductase SDR family protein 4
MNAPSFSLEGKTAIITGGRRGIGKAIALAFAHAGADVAVCDRVVEDGSLESAAEEIRALGRRSLALQADTSRKSDVDNLVQKVLGKFGGIDILVNSAGINIRGMLLDMTEDDWDAVLGVNLKGYYLCSQAVGKTMYERKKGNIINIAARSAVKATAGRGAYCISKAGVVMLTRVLAQELGGYGIRANAIAPGLVRTEFSSRPTSSWTDPAYLEKREAKIPLGRIAVTEDLIGTAVFLASDASSYITGATIFVDGGEAA